MGIEPSCILGFADEYADLVPEDAERAAKVGENVMLVEQFVSYALQQGARLELDGSRLPDKILFHGHCHQKARIGVASALQVLRSINGCETVEINSGCCGMAGSFGYETERYDISMQIGEMSLFPTIRKQKGDFVVVAEGVSCRQQISHGVNKRARHLVEVLEDALA